MRALLVLVAVLSLAGCRTSDDSAGTSNPEVTTPAEAPVDAADSEVMTPVDTADFR